MLITMPTDSVQLSTLLMILYDDGNAVVRVYQFVTHERFLCVQHQFFMLKCTIVMLSQPATVEM